MTVKLETKGEWKMGYQDEATAQIDKADNPDVNPKVNNNQAILDSLPQLEAYLRTHPNAPTFRGGIKLNEWCFDLESLKSAVRGLGSVTKNFDAGRYIEIKVSNLPKKVLEVSITCPRGKVCEEVITYKCSDEIASMLRSMDGEPAVEIKGA